MLLGAGVLLASCDGGDPDPREQECYVADDTPWMVKYDVLESPSQPDCADTGRPAGERLRISQRGREVDLFWRPQVLKPEVQDTYVPARGSMEPKRDAQRLCRAESFSVGGTDAPNPGLPSDSSLWAIQVQPSDVRFYVPPGRPGNQLSGELRYTEDGCTWRYAMRAIHPVVDCDPSLDPADPANAARTCGEGSGIDPSMAVVCDSQLSACVPAGPIPSHK
jgi:hypothetical protein